jgi:L-lactate dehydrogenase
MKKSKQKLLFDVNQVNILNNHNMEENKNGGQIRKVVVVGAGTVGATYCYALAQSGLADEIVILDRNEDLVLGQVLDLVHGQAFFPTVIIRAGSVSDYADAQLIVITAGSAQRPGETRLQLLKKNADIVGGIAEDVAMHGSPGVMLIVSNPVDVMTYIALKRSGWERGRVIGSGTVLDSARFRYLLSNHCGVDVHNVHAYILGEHGDSEFAAWSMTNVAGMVIDNYCPVCNKCTDWKAEQQEIEKQVRESAYHIINAKGSTHFAVGLALVRITAAILRKQSSVMTVSVLVDGEFGLKDVCISVPSIVSDKGVVKIINSPLSPGEMESLKRSAGILSEAIRSLD